MTTCFLDPEVALGGAMGREEREDDTMLEGQQKVDSRESEEFGKKWAILTNIQTYVRAVWGILGIFELFKILDWLNKDGQEYFCRALRELGQLYNIKVRGILQAEIVCGTPRNKNGEYSSRRVHIERKNDDLFIDGQRVIPMKLHIDVGVRSWDDVWWVGLAKERLETPKDQGWIKGLRDFLLLHPEFFPNSWSGNDQGLQALAFPDQQSGHIWGIGRNIYTGLVWEADDTFNPAAKIKPAAGQAWIGLAKSRV
ncbi:MAG: hypothetical protein WC385_00340 [Candidatus Paceibacterota bacterium]